MNYKIFFWLSLYVGTFAFAQEDQTWEKLAQEVQQRFTNGEYDKGLAVAKHTLKYATEKFGEKSSKTIGLKSSVGLFYLRLKDFKNAHVFFKKAYRDNYSFMGKEHPDTLMAMNDLGELYYYSKDYHKARDIWKKTWQLRKKKLGKTNRDTLISLANLASVYKLLKEYNISRQMYEQNVEVYTKVMGKESPSTIIFFVEMALLYKALREYKLSLEFFEKALKLREKVFGVKHSKTLYVWRQIALVYKEQKNLEKMVDYFEKSFSLYEEVKGLSDPETIRVLHELLQIYLDQENYKAALPLQIKLCDTLQEIRGQNHADTLMALNDLALTYDALVDYQKALEIMEKVLSRAKISLGETHRETLKVTINLAGLYRYLGEYAKALSLIENITPFLEQTFGENNQNVLIAKHLVARIYRGQGLYEKSLPLYESTVAKFREFLGKQHPHTLTAMNNLGVFYLSQGKIEKARNLFLEIYTLRQKIFGKTHIRTLIAQIYVAETYKLQNKFVEALNLYEDALEQFNKKKAAERVIALSYLTDFYNYTQQTQKVGSRYEECYDLSIKVFGKLHPNTLTAQENLAYFLQRQQKFVEASNIWYENIKNTDEFLLRELWKVDAQTRLKYLEKENEAKNHLLFFYTQYNNAESAQRLFYFSLVRKGLLLRIARKIHDVSSTSTNQNTQKMLLSLQQLRGEYASYFLKGDKDEQARILRRLTKLEKELSTKSEEVVESSYNFNLVEKIVAVIRPKQVLIDFLIFRKNKEDILIAVVIDKQYKEVFSLIEIGSLAPITSLIEAYHKQINKYSQKQNQNFQKLTKISQELYQKVWKPLLRHTESKKKVYIACDGILHLLPFSAIMDNNGEYLVENNSIVPISSGHDLLVPPAQNTSASLLIVNPKYGLPNSAKNSQDLFSKNRVFFESLPGTIKEGDNIYQQLQKKDLPCQKFSDKNAQENLLFQVNSPKILHIATHGYFLRSQKIQSGYSIEERFRGTASIISEFDMQDSTLPKNPLLLCGLAFAGANTRDGHNDGILTALEVLSLRLQNTELVVLSACETAKGEIVPGEGIYSLKRAFQEAGARNVIATLWVTADLATQKFMSKFYSRYLGGDPPQKALQDTQIEFIQSSRYNHPFFWSQFVMTGADLDFEGAEPIPPRKNIVGMEIIIFFMCMFILIGAIIWRIIVISKKQRIVKSTVLDKSRRKI